MDLIFIARLNLYSYLRQIKYPMKKLVNLRFSISKPLCADCSLFFLGVHPNERPKLFCFCGDHFFGHSRYGAPCEVVKSCFVNHNPRFECNHKFCKK